MELGLELGQGQGLGREFGHETRTLCVFVKRRNRLANWDVAMVVGR